MGFYLTRLVNKYIDRFETEDAAIRFFAPAVLAKEMKVRGEEGKSVGKVVDEIIVRVLG